ncbi:MAG TPA: hypothetical protein VGI90_07100 [Steroidobacteraceae bacterium]
MTAPATPQFRTQELLLEPSDYLGTPRRNRQPSGRTQSFDGAVATIESIEQTSRT